MQYYTVLNYTCRVLYRLEMNYVANSLYIYILHLVIPIIEPKLESTFYMFI